MSAGGGGGRRKRSYQEANKINKNNDDTNKNWIDIKINHQKCEELKGKSLDDAFCDISFMVEDEMIAAHHEVLDIFSAHRQMVKDLLKRDREQANRMNVAQANVFQMSGTTADSFRLFLEYLYTGCATITDEKLAIDLCMTSLKLKFYPLAAAVAHHLSNNSSFRIRMEIVDEIYFIAKNVMNTDLLKLCTTFMDQNAHEILQKCVKVDPDASPFDDDSITFVVDKPRFMNYIHFLLPEFKEICFQLKVSYDGNKWKIIANNENIWSKSWNWFYFPEQRVKFIKIICTDKEDPKYSLKHMFDTQSFECKRVNMDLKFDESTNYLIPQHNAVLYPVPDVKEYIDVEKNIFTYCMSNTTNKKDKTTYYYYHTIGDGKSLEFYLPQTCMIGAIRFHLWDRDDRLYDFTVHVKNEDDWELIGEYKDRRSWQTIEFKGGLRPVRWIQVQGTKGPPHDDEFAMFHFECPPQQDKHKKK